MKLKSMKNQGIIILPWMIITILACTMAISLFSILHNGVLYKLSLTLDGLVNDVVVMASNKVCMATTAKPSSINRSYSYSGGNVSYFFFSSSGSAGFSDCQIIDNDYTYKTVKNILQNNNYSGATYGGGFDEGLVGYYQDEGGKNPEIGGEAYTK